MCRKKELVKRLKWLSNHDNDMSLGLGSSGLKVKLQSAGKEVSSAANCDLGRL